MNTRDVVYSIMGGLLFLTFGLVFWPITVSAIAVTAAMSPLDKKWWHSPACFLLIIFMAAGISLAAGYPTYA